MRHVIVATLLAAAPVALRAQDHVHTPGMTHPQAALTQAGQAAFAALSEAVALLMADPSTDWTKVNIEALRQHLIDMNDVTMNSTVRSEPVAHGARFMVTGEGKTVDAIRRMVTAHAQTLESPMQAKVEQRAGGVTFTVTSTAPGGDARIRGLGFIGLMVLGDHHATHHLAIAKGETPAGHAHKH